MDSRANTFYKTTLRGVGVAQRVFHDGPSRGYLEFHLETKADGLVTKEFSCLEIEHEDFRKRLRMWVIGVALRNIRPINTVSTTREGRLFVQAIDEIRAYCDEADISAPQELKDIDFIEGYVDRIAKQAEETLRDLRSPLR